MNNRIFFLLLFVSLMVTTCSNRLNDLVIVAKLDNEFSVEIWEKIDTFGRSMEVVLRSEENLECSNIELNVSSGTDGNQLTIDVKDLANPTDCEHGVGVVLSRVDFGNLLPGYYTLKINLLDIAENEMLLDVTPERYLLSEIELNGLVIRREKLLRIPEKALWGYVGYKDAQEAIILESFLSPLESLTDDLELPTGDYGHFRIPSDPSSPEIDRDLEEGLTSTAFLLSDRNNLSQLDSLFKDFRGLIGDNAVLKVWSGRGNQW